jgi:hypothetical protein
MRRVYNLSARWDLLRWRWDKWLKTSRANRYRDELHFRVSKGVEVTVAEWQRSNEMLREAKEL